MAEGGFLVLCFLLLLLTLHHPFADLHRDTFAGPMEVSDDDAALQYMLFQVATFSTLSNRQNAEEENSPFFFLEVERKPTTLATSRPRRFYRTFWRGLSRRMVDKHTCICETTMLIC